MCSGLTIHAFKYSTVSAGRLDERPDPDFGVAMFRKSIADMVWLMLLTSSVPSSRQGEATWNLEQKGGEGQFHLFRNGRRTH